MARAKPLVLLVALMTAMVVGVTAQPAAAGADSVNTKKLRDAVTGNGILAHERALQRIADRNGGVRGAGTPGYAAAADYVKKTMRSAGYSVKEQQFTFPYYHRLAPAVLVQVAPAPITYEPSTFDYSGSGDVTGAVVPTNDVMIPPAPQPASTSGCEASDFPPVPPTVAQVALIQRGTCSFADKVHNAEAAGYAAVIFFNEGQPGRDGPLGGTLGVAATIPVVGALSFADGAALYAAAQAGATVHVVTSTANIPNTPTVNVIAETRGGDPNHVLLVGAHLDALPEGPGINENGSGVAVALEIAEQISRLGLTPRFKIRFVFFGAEETRARRDPNGPALSLLGSYNYVKSLSDAQLSRIYANLNLDSIGSTNYVRFVFNGDGPPGSMQITKIFTRLLHQSGAGDRAARADDVRRLDRRPVERSGHPDRRPVRRRRRDQDRGRGRDLWRDGRRALRRLFPSSLRQYQQSERQGADRVRRRRGGRDLDAGHAQAEPYRLIDPSVPASALDDALRDNALRDDGIDGTGRAAAAEGCVRVSISRSPVRCREVWMPAMGRRGIKQ